MLGAEGDRFVEVLRVASGELCFNFNFWKTRDGLVGFRGTGQFDVGDVVEVELLDFADEVWDGGGEADFFRETAQVDGAPLEGSVFSLSFSW